LCELFLLLQNGEKLQKYSISLLKNKGKVMILLTNIYLPG